MSPKQITACLDETFHPEICLVGIEPVSNFIILEVYADNRTAEAWNHCMTTGLEGLPVEVIQVTSDQGASLIAYARNELGVHHSPDLFHVQQELSRATSVTLTAQVTSAEAELQKQRDAIQALEVQRDACREQCPEGIVAFEQQLQQARAKETSSQENLEACQARQEQARDAICGIGEDYHPIDLQTGELNSADQVDAHLKAHFDTLEQIAGEANLSKNCKKRMAKARRVLAELVNTIVFFWMMVAAKVDSLSLSLIQRTAFYETLLPARYLAQAASKAATAEKRRQITTLAEELLQRARDGPLGQLTLEQWAVVDATAEESAELFQRSSSCVEGRNGQLALRHHSLHQLTPKKLGTLTTLHNYFICRVDGTTAAERFFGIRPRDLFAWLLDRIPVPARPASRRKPR